MDQKKQRADAGPESRAVFRVSVAESQNIPSWKGPIWVIESKLDSEPSLSREAVWKHAELCCAQIWGAISKDLSFLPMHSGVRLLS